ncbi:MAG: hypothetical protein HeimC2_19830 [Candidatus Heimdallarchaeota archaeon LC_2]|nr:MAG: hypothetical protein HeimC2_19830 [Candidatus Heimdallarchaeota archaeon LC_2]
MENQTAQLLETTIITLELVEREVSQIFGEEASKLNLSHIRAEYLQYFNIIAATLHQGNTIQWIKGNKFVSNLFEEEIHTANFRTADVQNEGLEIISKNYDLLEEHLEKIMKNKIMIDQFIFLISSNSGSSKNRQSLIITSRINKQTILYNLEELRSKVLIPAQNILDLELKAGSKILDVFETNKINDEDNLKESIARMCELISWGFENQIKWDDIQKSSKEISNNLKEELGSLRSLLITYSDTFNQ